MQLPRAATIKSGQCIQSGLKTIYTIIIKVLYDCPLNAPNLVSRPNTVVCILILYISSVFDCYFHLSIFTPDKSQPIEFRVV